MEVWEAKNPWLMEKFELAPDSGGPGQVPRRARAGHAFHIPRGRLLHVRPSSARRTRPGGSPAGCPAGRTRVLHHPDGTREPVAKATGLRIPKGATFEVHCGGGGGYGPPSERDPERVLADVREGYVTEAEARRHYPHAFDS